MATRIDELYEDDFFAWTREQAAALRRVAEQGSNLPLDFLHLAEEIEDLGDERRNAIRSQMRRAIEHLLKLEYSHQTLPRNGWKNSIANARAEIRDRLTRTLRNALEQDLDGLYAHGQRAAGRALTSYGEPDMASALPTRLPYKLDDILAEEWWPANRHGLADEPAATQPRRRR